MSGLPQRPAQVVAGALLLLGGAALLALAWVFGVDAVESNGARVFFVVVWSYLAWVVYGGGGWGRWGIVAIFAMTVWGCANAPSLQAALAHFTIGEVAAKALALAAFVLLLHPAARQWFAAVRRMEAGQEAPAKPS